MANLPTQMLRLFVERRHGLLLADLERAFLARRPADLSRALEALKFAKLIRWTITGWLATEAAVRYVQSGTAISFPKYVEASR